MPEIEMHAEIAVTLPALVERGPSGMHYAVVPALGLVVCGDDAEELADVMWDALEAVLPGAEIKNSIRNVMEDALHDGDLPAAVAEEVNIGGEG